MNVDDINDNVIPTDFSTKDRLDWIFSKQTILAHKYHPIEEKNNLLLDGDIPVNIEHCLGQARLKDFSWYVTEELAEALQAYEDHSEVPVHAIEELADALHFLVELYILSGNTSLDFVTGDYSDKLEQLYDDAPKFISFEYGMARTILAVGLAANCLKQKAWKQTHQHTDKPKFHAELKPALTRLLGLFKFCGVDAEGVFQIYFKKSAVNDFRIASKY